MSEKILADVLSEGKPLVDGLYVGYMAYMASPTKFFPMVMDWHAGKWWHELQSIPVRHDVRAWIGPLPSVSAPAPMEYDL